MQHANLPLTKRPRAAVACNACRQTKSKCDSARPVCSRCAARSVECIYTQTVWDKRLERQEDRRALLVLRNRVSELEAQLAAASSPRDAATNIQHPAMSSLAKEAAAEVSEAGSLDTNPESAADILATGAFDRLPTAEIGYFGPSSNHALLRSMAAFVTKLGARDSHLFQEEAPTERSVPMVPLPPMISTPTNTSKQAEGFPNPQTCVDWIARFFDTVGSVLPYISEGPLLREANRMGSRIWIDSPHSRSTKALLYIVFAHALSTLDDGMPDPFYHKSLGLLMTNEQSVFSWNLETVIALLLVGSYQQNSQRAMASLTTLCLAVKAAYQLGLHSPSTYEGLGVQEKELRVKVWYAIILQDRDLAKGLGRPCLIPPQYVQVEIPESIAPSKYAASTVTMSPSLKSSIYFSHLISLHDIVGDTLETIYSANIGSSQMPPKDATLKAISLFDQLEKWRDHNIHFPIITAATDVGSWSADTFQQEAHAVLLSLFYYRTVVLVGTPVLMAILEQVTSSAAGGDLSGMLKDVAASVLKRDWEAIREFQTLLSAILRRARPFLKSNAVWWVCNFTALTVCWHGLGLWLIAMRSTSLPPAIGITNSEAELFLVEGLDTLKSVGGSSIMSGKAHRFLQRLIRLLKTMGKHRRRASSSRTNCDHKTLPPSSNRACSTPRQAARMACLTTTFWISCLGLWTISSVRWATATFSGRTC
ncbi:fungal-specific transcription factor domain-containing protein [Dactylonectria estremocensis]|uniref:Fungal-specific transcription factor domain-containing protein n=1 Tax=Dactylonectria estremocensis TaxID=1079267 RepID=A0A9P9EHS5_9HYPO|nr:fungal-specific transcription factor domain-containing protein [Dactylonectria estremocensis]